MGKPSGQIDNLLVRDYHPKSNLVVPQTNLTKARFPVKDMHCHGLRHGKWNEQPGPDQVDEWAKILKAVNIQKSVVMVRSTGDAFKRDAELYGCHPEVLELWCGFDLSHISEPDFEKHAIRELEACHKAGARGVGELGDKGNGVWGLRNIEVKEPVHHNDPRFRALFAKCAELGMPVNIHMGDPIWSYQKVDGTNEALFEAQNWTTYGKGLPPWEEICAWRDQMLEENPKTTFVFAHFNNMAHDLASVGKLLDRYPNAYCDISARFRDIGRQPRFAAEFITKYQDRLVYGTDMAITKEMYLGTFRVMETADEYFKPVDGGQMLWMAYGLDLPDEVLKKVYWENAERLMGKSH